MLNDAYKQEMDRLTLEEDFRQRLVTAMTQEKPHSQKKRRPLRAIWVAAAVCAALVGSALALSPTFRDIILTSLGFRAPYATEVLASCQDKGITIEAQSALTDGRMTRLYFTVHDPSGVFFLEDTQNDLYMDFLAGEEEIPGSAGRREDGLERLSYDTETQTALYVFRIGPTGYESATPPTLTHTKLTMSYYLPGYRCWGGEHFSGPMPFGKPTLPIDILETTTENGAVVLLPDQTPHTPDEDCPEVYISSMGFDAEGVYHVRVHADSGIINATGVDCQDLPPFHVYYDIFTSDGKSYDGYYNSYDDDVVTTPVSDGWDYRLSKLTRETYPQLGTLRIFAWYSISGSYRQGNWELTIPIEQVETRTAEPKETLILSRTKDDPPPSGLSHEAQVSSVSVSSLSVVADFTRPENYHLCADVDGYATACTVTFADGSTREPDFFREAWSGSGWVMWEFPEAIDPAQVVSVSLNGSEIPF